MKVLRLIGGLDPEHGGPSVSAANGAIAAQREGVATTFACPVPRRGDGPPGLARLREEGVEAVTFPFARATGRIGEDWGISGGLLGWMRGNLGRFDIVQCHASWQMVTLTTLLMRRARGPRIVLMPHESLTDYDVAATSRPGMAWIKRWLRPRLLKGFDRIVFASPLEARDSVPASVAQAVRREIVYHPVFDERREGPPAAPRPGGDGFAVGFLGRLHSKKNVDLLIDALARVPESVTLRIAGDGPELGRLRALADLRRVGRRIDWLGFVDGTAKPAFFGAIDVLVMPSDYECFGMAIAEAMCAGVPVIVSEETGVTEVVRRYGCGLVVRREAAAIAKALERLADDPAARREMAGKAATAARAEFSFAAHGRAMAACYEALLAEPSPRLGPAHEESR